MTPIPDGQHDQLPPHIRKGIDDSMARIERDERAIADAAPGADFPAWLGWLILAGLLVVGACLLVLFLELGRAANVDGSRDFVIITTPSTYGAPPR